MVICGRKNGCTICNIIKKPVNRQNQRYYHVKYINPDKTTKLHELRDICCRETPPNVEGVSPIQHKDVVSPASESNMTDLFTIAFVLKDSTVPSAVASSMIFLKQQNLDPSRDLVKQSAIMSSMGQYSMQTDPLATLSVMQKYLMSMC
jgi:hypothetical protein